MPECQSKTIPRGVSFAGMAVFFPVPSGGQLSGMGGQFHRNRGSVWSGINNMRKSFYTLSGVVNSLMNQDVRDGGVFIFMNRHQNVMKILHMEYAGLVIYHKRLESGRFRLPVFDETTGSINIDWKDLMSMVENVKPRCSKARRIVNNYQSFS